MVISIVVPAYNEGSGIVRFHHELLKPALEGTAYRFEIIYVDDGSSDRTLCRLKELAAADPTIRVLSLSRNFGKEIATTAGIYESLGDAVILLDADGQHPPHLIPTFLDRWRGGAQVVIGVRQSNQNEGVMKRWGSRLFYTAFNSSSGAHIVPGSTDFRLIDGVVRKEFVTFTEQKRITRGLIDWLGFQREYIPFNAPPRLAGRASYNTSHMVRLAMNSFVSLSFRPLYAVGWLGAVITALSLIAGLSIFMEQFILSDPLGLRFTGSALLGIFVSFLVGLVLISQGVLALYLSHIHSHTQNRPLYVINRPNSVNLHAR